MLGLGKGVSPTPQHPPGQLGRSRSPQSLKACRPRRGGPELSPAAGLSSSTGRAGSRVAAGLSWDGFPSSQARSP